MAKSITALFNSIDNIIESTWSDYSNFWTTSTINTGGNWNNYSIANPQYFDEYFKSAKELSEQWNGDNLLPYNIFINNETKDLIYEFAVAGYSKENISLEFDEDQMVLILTKDNKERKGFTILKKNIKESQVIFKLACPTSVYEVEKSLAELKDGILKIVIPKKESKKPKKIEIN